MLEPYYQDRQVTIYHGDARDVLPQLAPVDQVLTDPPYNYGSYETDVAPPIDVVVSAAERRAVFGYPQSLFDWMAAAGMPTEWLVWWPTNGALRGGMGRGKVQRETEHIAIWGAAGEAREPKSTRAIDPEAYGKLPDRKACDVWRDPSPGLGFNTKHRLHPNEKPVSLMARLARLMGDGTIIDPFMGSGTTLVAAKELGRKAIGVEISREYCDVAVKRLRQEVLF